MWVDYGRFVGLWIEAGRAPTSELWRLWSWKGKYRGGWMEEGKGLTVGGEIFGILVSWCFLFGCVSFGVFYRFLRLQ